MMPFARLFNKKTNAAEIGRQLIQWSETPEAVYAVGDVHGCLRELIELESRISEDVAKTQGRKVVVYLGDYVDRGPNSYGVIEHLLAPAPPEFERQFLVGNHEIMFLDFLASPAKCLNWLEYGGRETLSSYGIGEVDRKTDMRRLSLQLEAMIPDTHRAFLETLPAALDLPDYFLVHAGINPSRPLLDQRFEDMISIRNGFVDHEGPMEKCVVHGHTPVPDVVISQYRISVDTGAYGTGRLSAIKLAGTDSPRVFCSGNGALGKSRHRGTDGKRRS